MAAGLHSTIAVAQGPSCPQHVGSSQSGIKMVSLALQGRFLTTGPPGKPCFFLIIYPQFFPLLSLPPWPPQVCSLCFFVVVQLLSCVPMNFRTPGFQVLHYLPEFAHVLWVRDAIQPSHPLSPPFPALNLFEQQGLFQWVSSLHQVAKVLEFQLQHQSFQWIFRVDFL